jgi:hypothetical protein
MLRRLPWADYEAFRAGGNGFATTLAVLASAVAKLARVTKLPPGLALYRGLGGLVDLPAAFWKADANGCRGYTELGFMSTTSRKATALEYSGAKEKRPKPTARRPSAPHPCCPGPKVPAHWQSQASWATGSTRPGPQSTQHPLGRRRACTPALPDPPPRRELPSAILPSARRHTPHPPLARARGAADRAAQTRGPALFAPVNREPPDRAGGPRGPQRTIPSTPGLCADCERAPNRAGGRCCGSCRGRWTAAPASRS